MATGIECCGKCFLVFINIIFMILGFVFLALGAVLLAGQSTLRSAFDLESTIEELLEKLTDTGNVAEKAVETVDDFFKLFEGIGIAILVLGIFMFAVSMIGCCGACCSFRVMLIVYVVIVGVLLLAQIILMALYGAGTFDKEMKKSIKKKLEEKYEGARGVGFETLLWNVIQSEFECCGVDSYKDFDNAKVWDRNVGYEFEGVVFNGTLVIPATCCKLTDSFLNGGSFVDDQCPFQPSDDNSNRNTGCFDTIRDDFKSVKSGLLGVTGGFLFLEILCLVFGILILVLGKSAVDPV